MKRWPWPTMSAVGRSLRLVQRSGRSGVGGRAEVACGAGCRLCICGTRSLCFAGYTAHRLRMIGFGAISAIGAIAVLTLVQVALAENGQSGPSAQPSLRSASSTSTSLLLEARLPQPLSRNQNDSLRPMDHFKECEACPEMIVVPAGQFTMGAGENEVGSTPDERPQHLVIFAKTFAVGRFAVTFDEWDACIAAKGCSYRPSDQDWGRGKQPVINIRWSDAKEYVEWLSRKTGRLYRLLSEAEREYVTRAGTSTAYWWGDDFKALQANSAYPINQQQPTTPRTVSVDSFVPNPWGFFQVHGNVYDWVEDCGSENYIDAPPDGAAQLTGNCEVHMLRGGAFSRRPETLRSAARLWSGNLNRMTYMSVRVARELGGNCCR
jgi:formylglycine-generating enzyme required for sulfatase activity